MMSLSKLNIATLLLATALTSACSSQARTPESRTLAKPAFAATAEHPTVVELFQSQGCSSCPPANANVNAIADRPGILVLSFAVTYWDRLGWKDRFASPSYTERQWDYARGGGRDTVYTPQVIINGKTAIVGANRAQFERSIAAAGRPVGGPELTAKANRVTVAAGEPGGTIWLVRYDPKSRDVPIRAGENSGRTLPHRHIVTQLVRLGEVGNTSRSYDLPQANQPGLDSAVLVQTRPGGPISSALRLGKRA